MRSHIGMTIGISVLFLVGVAVLYFVPYGYWIAAVLGVIGINTVPVLMKSNQDEQGDLQKSAMQLSKVATGIEKVTLKVKSGVESFGGDASKQVQETEHLAEVLARSKTQTEKIGTMSENTLDAMSNTLASVSQAVSVIHSLNNSLEDIGKSNQDISSIANQASQALFRAREAVETIQQRTEAIDEIVVQTKLLSFNASIEAARAGQEGKGFAVVAEEVGRLADNSGRIAKEINQIVIQTVESITQSSKEFEKRNADCQEINHKNVTDGIGLAQDAQSAIETIRKEAGTSLECMGEAKELSMQLLQAMDLNTKIADQLNVISHANLDQAKTFEELSKVLGRGVEDLNGLMSDIIGIATGSIVKDIDCAVADKIRDQHTLIDVRRPAEFNDELGHVSKAILLTLDEEFENKIKDYDPNNHYIFICRSGGRSARAARIALSLGFKHISNLEGGMLAWNNKFHLPVERKA